MKESDIPPPATPVIIQLYDDLGEQLLDIVEEKCGDHRIVSGVCPNLTEAKRTADGKNAGKPLRKNGRRLRTNSTDCKLPSIGGGLTQKIDINNDKNYDFSSSYEKKPFEIPPENFKIKFTKMEGNFSPRTGFDKKKNASKPKTTAQVTARKPKGERRVGETLPKITVTPEVTKKGRYSLRNGQLSNNTSVNICATEKSGTHLNVTVPNEHIEDKCNTVNKMSQRMAKSLDQTKHVSPQDSVNNNRLKADKKVNAKTSPQKKQQKDNDSKTEVKTSQKTKECSKDSGNNKNPQKNDTEKKAQEISTKKSKDPKDCTETNNTTPHELNENFKRNVTESCDVSEKNEKETTRSNVGANKPKDDTTKASSEAPVEKKRTLEVETRRTKDENKTVPTERTVEQKQIVFTVAPPPKRSTKESKKDKEDTKPMKKIPTKPSKAKYDATKDEKSGPDTQKKNLRLCEVLKKGDKNVPKYKDIHLNVKEKRNASKEALEVTSMHCEELKEANMYLTKILGMEKNARTIQLIDQLQRHQKTLEAELEEARRKETHAQERAEKAERQANEISQQVEQVRRSRDKTLSEKEQLLQQVEKERTAFEKVRQHVDTVGKMRQRAHQVKENALRQRNKLAKDIEAERAKMSAMLLAMKEVNTQKFNAERRRLNMVRMKNKLAKERDEERAKLRELHDTIEEMKKEKEEAVKQKYRALKQRDEARTTCRKLNGELKELRESVDSLNESGCFVLETTERLAVVENTRRSTVTNSNKNPRSMFPSIDNKRSQRVLRASVPHPGVSKTKVPAKLPKMSQIQGTVPTPVRGGYPSVHGGRPIPYDQWSSAYNHDVMESDVIRGGAEVYDYGFYDDDHSDHLTRSYVQYADLQATGHHRALVNRPPHQAGQWKKYPTGETLATHSHRRPPTLSDNGFHSNADVNYEESDDVATSTTESGSHGNTVDRQVSAHLEGLSSDPRAHVTHGYHGNMVDRQVSAHLCHWDCDCARNNVDQPESVKLPMIKSDQSYRQSGINSSIVNPSRMKFPEL
ncbi:uncharacterized protein LOC144887473 [Branchiostoma floridae x Branchiostoma japonicum]